MASEGTIDILKNLNDEQLATLLIAPFCCYCLKTKEPFEKCTNHYMCTDSGRICCPKLLMDACPDCGATGEFAHIASRCPLLEENSTIHSIPSTLITGENSLGSRITNKSSFVSLERKRKHFKKEKPLRIQLLKHLHEKASEKYWRQVEEAFEAEKKEHFLEKEIKNSEELITRRNAKDAKKRNNATLNDQPEVLKRKELVPTHDASLIKLKRRRLNLFK